MIDALIKKACERCEEHATMGIANVCYNVLYMGYMLKQRRKKK